MDEIARRAREVLKGNPPPELESLVLAYRQLRSEFPGKSESWFYRAVYRALAGVEALRDGHWLVKGFRELGDSRPFYNVWLAGGRYKCDCFYHAHGYSREREICTHIAAVMLWRRQTRLSEFSSRGR